MIIDEKLQELAKQRLDRKFEIEEGSVIYEHRKKSKSLKVSEPRDYLDFERENIASTYKNQLHSLDQGAIYISRSKTNGRLDHNLTNMHKGLLKWLDLDGENPYEIDKAGSQPLLLANLISNSISNIETKKSAGVGFTNSETNSLINDKCLEDYLTTLNTRTNTSTSPLLCSHQELVFFRQLVEQGKIYEYFALRLFGSSSKVERNRAKGIFITALYSRYNHSSNDDKRDFQQVFPQLSAFLDGFKEYMVEVFKNPDVDCIKRIKVDPERYRFSNNKGRKSNYEAANDYLAIRLQEIESEIFIDRLLPVLQGKDWIVIPKHDAILCKESDAEEVHKEASNILSSIFGGNGLKFRRSNLRQEDPKPLNNIHRANGITLELVARASSAAIYKLDIDGATRFEVIRIRVREARTFKGKSYPRREKYPSNEDWGSFGWTLPNIERAWELFLELLIYDRPLSKLRASAIDHDFIQQVKNTCPVPQALKAGVGTTSYPVSDLP